LPKKTFEAAAAANAHLIVQLKDNQPTLCQNVEAVCAAAEPTSSVQTVDKKRRNRHETRTITVFDAKPAVEETEWEPHVAAVIQVERAVNVRQAATGLWKPSHEISHYLSNRPVTAQIAAAAIRQHWGIENKSHYTRDVTLREDASRIRTNPRNLRQIAQLHVQYLALQSIRHDPSRSFRRRSRRPQINVRNDLQ
jgi:predicted transposase YbfD/YdcC